MKANYARKGRTINLRWDRGVFVPVDERDIVDAVEEANTEIVFNWIVEHATLEKPLGVHHNSSKPFYGMTLKDGDGKKIGREMKKRLLNALISDNRVELIKNSKHMNGLWPVE